MREHAWVEIQYMPVTVEVDEETGDVIISGTKEAEEVAKAEATYGCWHCEIELTTESVKTECEAVSAVVPE